MRKTNTDYLSLAKQALAESVKGEYGSDNFRYYGELAVGKTWAFTFSRTRDSDLMAESNFEVIHADLKKRFPKQVDITRCSHWGCGWVEYITVKVLHNGKVTLAGKAAIDWKLALDDYPIADDSDFSEREQEKFEAEYDYYKSDFVENICKFLNIDVPEDYQSKDYEALESLAYHLYEASRGYYGLEDAYVSKRQIPNVVHQVIRDHLDPLTQSYFDRVTTKVESLKNTQSA